MQAHAVALRTSCCWWGRAPVVRHEALVHDRSCSSEQCSSPTRRHTSSSADSSLPLTAVGCVRDTSDCTDPRGALDGSRWVELNTPLQRAHGAGGVGPYLRALTLHAGAVRVEGRFQNLTLFNFS